MYINTYTNVHKHTNVYECKKIFTNQAGATGRPGRP